MNFTMNKSDSKREDESTLLSTMARVPLKSANFSINALLPEITRETPQEASPAPSVESDGESSNEDVNVDYESDLEGKHHKSQIRRNKKFIVQCE